MSPIEEDLNTFRLYGSGLSQFEDEPFEDEAEVGVILTDILDDETEEKLYSIEELELIDLQRLASHILKMLKQELVLERERTGKS